MDNIKEVRYFECTCSKCGKVVKNKRGWADLHINGWKQIGVFQGYIDDIAFALAEKCCYSLEFEKVCTDIPVPKRVLDEVNVTLDINSETWKLSPIDRIGFFRNMLQDRNTFVSKGSAYASVTLSRKNLEKDKREVALAKLTAEEKVLLGLSC